MKIRQKEIATIFHVSKERPFKSIVTSVSDDIISLKLVQAFLDLDFNENDPVILAFHTSGQVHIAECKVKNISLFQEEIYFSTEKIESFKDGRKDERFFVSIPALVTQSNLPSKYKVKIEDVSFSGMRISLDSELPSEKELYVNICVSEEDISLQVKLIRSKRLGTKYEYGLEILDGANNSKELFSHFVQGVMIEQESALNELRNFDTE